MWLSIIILGTIISILIWLIQREKWSLILRLPIVIGVLIVMGAFFFIDENINIISLGNDTWYNQSPFMEIIFFAFMLTGMAVRYVTNSIEERRKKMIEFKKKTKKDDKIIRPKLEFDMWEFSYPFFFSIITFGLLLKQIDVEQVTISNVILSFQTGFFWQTILKKQIYT
jgi:hypothetical protein